MMIKAEQSATEQEIRSEFDAGKAKGRGVCSLCGNESEIRVET